MGLAARVVGGPGEEEMRVKQSEKAGRQSEGQTVELKEGQAV